MSPVPGTPQGFGRPSTTPAPAACPCGAGAYASCCGPLIAGSQLAETAEQMMRSRYSAFALAARDPQAIEHLLRTHPEPGQPEAERRQGLKASARSLKWIGLSVLEAQAGGPLDSHGTVTFEARWRDREGREGVLRECSRFERGEAGEWLYQEALRLGEGTGG
jgi:SEC-C motif-containing protein